MAVAARAGGRMLGTLVAGALLLTAPTALAKEKKKPVKSPPKSTTPAKATTPVANTPSTPATTPTTPATTTGATATTPSSTPASANTPAAPSLPAAAASTPATTPPAEPPAPAPPPSFVPGTGTRADVKPYYFAIPAPRGQILDRKGRALAQNALVGRIQFTVPAAQRETQEGFTIWLQEQVDAGKAELPALRMPDAETLQRHYESRRELPITVSDALTKEIALDPKKHPYASVRTEYVRHYPHGDMAAHLLGYIASDGGAPAGPVVRNEALWQRTRGATGLEAAYNKQLTGTDGTYCLVMTDAGTVAYEQVFTAPVAGRDVVTTLNLETQRSVEAALDHSGHRCAMVIVDANTGDIRAMASRPRYDPNAFAGGISADAFTALTNDINGPLFDRALQGTYPPGSVFKPMVVLAGLRAYTVDAERSFECGPTLNIDGRDFDNWSKDDRGWFNARDAIIRSCNTYFYQSAMVTRDVPILYMAHEFGYGQAPVLPLKAAAGSLPQRAPSNQELANLAIGQGITEASPLQVAMAMATLANGACRPRSRLVMQTQSQTGQLGDVTVPCREVLMPVSQPDLDMVRHAMFGVVNHVRGTGKAARLKKIPVFGKTGTAQWVLRGQKANVVWFAGYVATTPPLAFAVMIEGNAAEGGLSGGGTAAPVIAKVLHEIESKPGAHEVAYEPIDVVEENDPLAVPLTPDYMMDQAPPFMFGGPPPPQYRENPVGGFFQRLFR